MCCSKLTGLWFKIAGACGEGLQRMGPLNCNLKGELDPWWATHAMDATPGRETGVREALKAWETLKSLRIFILAGEVGRGQARQG